MPYRRLAWLFALPLMLPAPLAGAEEKRMSASEIAATITGNSIEGLYDGDRYRQYFGADGETIFQLEDGRTFSGDWHVDEEQDKYCSYQWYRGTKCYTLFIKGEEIVWLEDDSDDRLPSTLIEGKLLYED